MNSEFFTGNRAGLRKFVQPETVVVVAANGLLQRNGDTTFPFCQDSNFYYLTGLNEPDLVLVIDGASEYLIVPGRDQDRANFDGAVDFGELARRSGISEILDEKAGWKELRERPGPAQVATLAPVASYEQRHGFYANPARARLMKRLRRLMPKPDFIYLNKTLAEMRMVKQPAEIATIQRAIDVTIAGVEKISENVTSFNYEYEIEAELTRCFRARGASGHAFAPIVAGGKRACTLHNVANDSRLHTGELVTIDVGAEVDNYAADITRTLAVGRPSKRQQQVYNAVLEVQNYGLKLLKPGVLMKDYEAKIEEFMGQKLVGLGLIKNAGDRAAIRNYYPHATSHFMGLDVHDVGDYRQPLVENIVLTCEPGIYIPEEGIGVRIEDDVLITTDSSRVLSSELKRKLC